MIGATALTSVPDTVDLELATAVLNDGRTSQLLIDVAEPRSDDVVLILAARGEAKLAALRGLGVDHVIDYGNPQWTHAVVELTGRAPSVVFDGAGAQLGQQAFTIASRGARFLTYGSSAGEFTEPDRDETAARSIAVTGLFDLPALTPAKRAALVVRAMTSAQTGEARPKVTLIPLAGAARAHQALEDRTAIGKTLLTQ